MIFIGIHWSAIFLFLVIALLGLWVSYSFLNKSGFFLFSILAIMIGFFLPLVQMFNLPVSITYVLMPLVYFSLVIIDEKYGRDDFKRLSIWIMSSILVFVISVFFISAYADSSTNTLVFLSWEFLGPYVSTIVSCSISLFVLSLISGKFVALQEKKYLNRAVCTSIVSVLHAVIYVVLSTLGLHSFGNILLIVLIGVLFSIASSFAVCYITKYLNRKPVNPIEDIPDKEE